MLELELELLWEFMDMDGSLVWYWYDTWGYHGSGMGVVIPLDNHGSTMLDQNTATTLESSGVYLFRCLSIACIQSNGWVLGSYYSSLIFGQV